MGKSILIITIGLSLIIGFIILKLNANSKEGLSVTVHQFDITQARLIANSGVETYLEKMRRNKTLSGDFTDNPLFGGTYDIHISGPDSNLTIRSLGKFDDITHETIVNAKRSPIQLPPVYGSLFVSSTNLFLLETEPTLAVVICGLNFLKSFLMSGRLPEISKCKGSNL